MNSFSISNDWIEFLVFYYFDKLCRVLLAYVNVFNLITINIIIGIGQNLAMHA